MRTDYAMLSRFQLHSTSDQQDFSRYPPIAAAAPIAIAPEQAAVWAYPQPEWDDDQIAFALQRHARPCASFRPLGPHDGAQQRLVAEAIGTYKHIRADLARRPVLAARATRLGRPVGGPRDAGALGQLSGCLAPRIYR